MNVFNSNVLKLGGGTALGQVLPILSTPLITRLYSPDDMGVLGLFMSFVGFFCVAVSLRYEILVVSEHDENKAACLLTASLLLTVPMSLFGGFILNLLISYNLLSLGSLPAWSPVAAMFLLILTGSFTALRYWSVREMRYGEIGRALVFQGIGRAVLPVIFGLMHFGWIGLLIGELTSRVLGVGKLLRVALPAIVSSLRLVSPNYFFQILRQNWKSPAILLPSSMIDSLSAMLPLPIISHLYGAQAAGEFFLVQRLCSLPAGLIVASVADVFHSTISKLHQQEPTQVRGELLRVGKKLFKVSVVVYVPIALGAPFIFGFLFGKEWDAAGIYMAILAPISLVSLVVSPLSRLLIVVDKVGFKLISDIFSLLVPIVSLYGMSLLGYDILPALVVYMIFNILNYLNYYGLILKATGSNV